MVEIPVIVLFVVLENAVVHILEHVIHNDAQREDIVPLGGHPLSEPVDCLCGYSTGVLGHFLLDTEDVEHLPICVGVTVSSVACSRLCEFHILERVFDRGKSFFLEAIRIYIRIIKVVVTDVGDFIKMRAKALFSAVFATGDSKIGAVDPVLGVRILAFFLSTAKPCAVL